MVTKPNTPVPPTSTVPKPLPKIEPMETVSGVAAGSKTGSNEDVANRDRTGENKFELPRQVTPQEVKDQSYRYGGGRSAGKRSTMP